MRTITIKKDLYKFEELDEKVQEKLIKDEIEFQQDFFENEFLQEEMENVASELLEKYFRGAKLIEVYYDLSYSQGSGAMIEFEMEYYGKNVKVRQFGHYYHERSFAIESDLTEKVEQKLREKIASMNSELTKKGYEMVEYYYTEAGISDIKEILKENEYTKDGEIYYEI